MWEFCKVKPFVEVHDLESLSLSSLSERAQSLNPKPKTVMMGTHPAPPSPAMREPTSRKKTSTFEMGFYYVVLEDLDPCASASLVLRLQASIQTRLLLLWVLGR